MSKARTKKWTKSPNEMILAMPSENFLIVDTKNECGKLSGSYHFTEYREDGTIVNEVDALKITPSKQQSDLLQIEDISIFNTKSISYGYSSLARQCVFSSAYNNGTNFTYEGATFT
ncbi:hypothetical protein ISS03_05800 [Patescibacteria group bacterium]|nr:hypothetical protein [Patescibacteria group bacterium]